jgi:hypothetical protein
LQIFSFPFLRQGILSLNSGLHALPLELSL